MDSVKSGLGFGVDNIRLIDVLVEYRVFTICGKDGSVVDISIRVN